MDQDRNEDNFLPPRSGVKHQVEILHGNKLDVIAEKLEHLAVKIRSTYGLSRSEAEKQLAIWQASHQ
jgi:hypothetical protein